MAGPATAALQLLSDKGCTAEALASFVEMIGETTRFRPMVEDAVQLVMTGPESSGAYHRDTGVVVGDLFRRAQTSVLVAGYAVYQGKQVFVEFGRRMEELPNLHVRLFLNLTPKGIEAVVFQLSRPAVESQPWTETLLHTFEGGTDGALLDGSLSVDRHGAVYGTTYKGGTGFCSGMGCGTVFLLKPPAQPVGPWIETLYSFQGGSDGAMPQGSVLVNEKTGILYGTTTFGGAYNAGIVYELVFP